MIVIPKSFRLALPALAALACSGGDLVLPGDGEPAAITILQGNGQSGRVGERLGLPVRVRVTDGSGRPVAGAAVVLELIDPGPQTEIEPDTAETDADGVATFQVRLGTRVGPLTGQARLVAPDGAPDLDAPVSFTALSAQANGMAILSGDNQSAPAGQGLAQPLVVQVTDGFGNPIEGVSIQWQAQEGGSLSAEQSVTDADGQAAVERVLGTSVGAQHTEARSEGLAGSPAVFTHTALAGDASRLELVSGNDQSAVVGTRVPEDLVVRLLDANDNPVSGIAVTWVIGSGQGSVAPATGITDETGIARTVWTLGPQPGTNTVNAVVSGIGVVQFSAIGEPGVPPGMALQVQPSATARRGVAFERQPVIQLKEPDGGDRRQAGVVVSVSLQGGGRLRGTMSRTTTAQGQATFTDLSIEGLPGSYVLAFSATGFSGAVSDGIALAKALTTTSITGDTPDPSTPEGEVRVSFGVQSDGGTPSGTVTVSSDDGSACGAPVSAGACTLRPQQAGSRTLTATYAGNLEFEGSTDTEQHTVETPPKASTTTRITGDTPDPSTPGAEVVVSFTVESNGGDPSGTVNVSSDDGSSCSASVESGACVLRPQQEGNRTLTATYVGNEQFEASSDTEQHSVETPAQPALDIRRQPSSSARLGVRFDQQPEIRLVQAGGDLKQEGVPVTAVIGSGGGTLLGATTVTTDRDGRAHFADLAIAGSPGTRTLLFSAGGFTSATSQPIEVTRSPTETRIEDDKPDPSQLGEAVTIKFRVRAEGANPPGTVTITADGAGESCSAGTEIGSCTITLTQAGERTLTANYSGNELFDPSSDTEPHRVEAANVGPAPVPDAFETIEGANHTLSVPAPGVLGNDTDSNGDPLTAELTSGVSNGQLTFNQNGSFSYTPVANFFGDDGFTYRASDGSAQSAPVSVRIAVRPVNDPPFFTRGPDVAVGALSGPQTVSGWATGITPGPPNEADQQVQFEVQVVGGSILFLSPPAISADGTLTFTPLGLPGQSTISVVLRDSGGTEDGGSDTFGPVTFQISVGQ